MVPTRARRPQKQNMISTALFIMLVASLATDTHGHPQGPRKGNDYGDKIFGQAKKYVDVQLQVPGGGNVFEFSKIIKNEMPLGKFLQQLTDKYCRQNQPPCHVTISVS